VRLRRSRTDRGPISTVGLLVRFTAAGLIVLLSLAALIALVARQAGVEQARDSARQVTFVTARGVVEPRLDAGVIAGQQAALRSFDAAMRKYVLQGSLVRVKLWNADGRIVYSDEPRLIGQQFPLLPANLKPPIPVTNIAQYGYALDNDTSPPSLSAAQAHMGKLAASGDPRGWDQAGEITPILRYAEMFSGKGLKGLDGTAWYHPQRLTLDSGAVAAGNANPAQQILDVHAIHGHDLPKRLRIYAFGAALGGQRVLDAAQNLVNQSGIPSENLMLVNRASTYAHNDPNSAFPQNDFLENLVFFLQSIPR